MHEPAIRRRWRLGLTGKVRPFGWIGGQPVDRIGLRSGQLQVEIITFGATIRNILVHGLSAPQNVVLGFETAEEYFAHRSCYVGCIIGRFANRIARGSFSLDGTLYHLTRNENGSNHLHGGSDAFSNKIWTIEDVTESSVELSLTSPAGDQGYPGSITAKCRYSIESDRRLKISLSAISDAPTIINLTAHSYFNLSGAPTIAEHKVQIPAENFLPCDNFHIPTGEILSVAGTPYDFRQMRPLDLQNGSSQYDHAYIFDRAPAAEVRKVAGVQSDLARLGLQVWSTEPCVQFYDGGSMPAIVRSSGPDLGCHAGLCLEPQRFPDSPNHINFSDATLNPGDTYTHRTEYHFECLES
jgi:aldose 1-epimerase